MPAETEIQRRQALDIMSGYHGKKYESWRSKLLKILANVEAKIDFPEDDLPQGIIDEIQSICNQVKDEIKNTE